MATATLAPYPAQFFTDAGLVAASYKLYTYLAGTTTNAATFSDANQGATNANPIILDSAGRASIFLDSSKSYKFVLKTAADVTVWTRDGIGGVPFPNGNVDVEGTAGETITAGQVCFISDGTGGLTAGRFYVATNASLSASYKYIRAETLAFALAAVASGSSGTFRIGGRMDGLSGLTAGYVYSVGASGALAAATGLNGVPQRYIGIASTTTSLLMVPEYIEVANRQYKEINFTVGIKGGAAVSTGVHCDMYIPYGIYLAGWTILPDQSGSIVFDIWKDTYAAGPPTIADTITASDKPTLTTTTKAQGTALTGWTKYIPEGSWLRLNVDSCTSCTFVTLTLHGYVIV